MKQKFVVIDGNSLLHRAFHALPLLTNSKGQFTNAVYGFTTMLMRLISDESPDYLLVAFDKGKKTFRHEFFGEYKGTRKETPAELGEQFQRVRDLLEGVGIPFVEMENYEADDLIGTLARKAEQEGLEVLIVSGDRDTLQLITENTRVLMTRKGISQTERLDLAWLQKEYGFTPEQMIDLKALMGDSSDNIPGVPGVGEKTAKKLLEKYKTLDGVYEHLEEISGKKLNENLRENREKAYLSRRLGTICLEVPLEGSPRDYPFRGLDPVKGSRIFRDLEFYSLLKQLPETETPVPEETAGGENVAGPAFQLEETQEDGRLLEFIREHKEEALAVAFLAGGEPETPLLGEMALAAGDAVLLWQTALGSHGGTEEICRTLLEERSRPVYCHTGKELAGLAVRHGVSAGRVRDTRIMAYLLESEQKEYPVEGLMTRYGLGPSGLTGSAGLAADTLAVAGPLEDELRREDLYALYNDLEQPLLELLCRMEAHGIRVDSRYLEEVSRELNLRIEGIQAEIYSLAGREFNINSTRQLADVLFGDLGLTGMKKTKTGYSTDAEVLEKLRFHHPIVEKILDYRQLVKLVSTYVDGLIALSRQGNGLVHTTYHQTVAATGRLSSTDPNLQNIPIRTEEGKRLRRAFKPRDPGNLLLAADYSQIELRVLAHLSGDEKMLESFRRQEDIHTRTAAEVFGVDPEEVDSEMRRRAKAVNFGIVYGISDFGLSRDLGIPVKEAGDYISLYFARYPGVKEFIDRTVEETRRTGMVTTLLGRRRRVPNIVSKNYNLRGAAERIAMNTPIQGTAADIIKLAMLKTADALETAGLQACMVLQVHDEIILEVPPEEMKQAAGILKKSMEGAVSLKIPVSVDLKAGPTWFDMERMDPDA